MRTTDDDNHPRRQFVAPTERPDESNIGGTLLEHPAFGTISVHRMHSSHPVRLFGSDLGHRETIRIEIRESSMHRRLSEDRTHAGKIVCEFEMSPAQWVQMIASSGMFEGTPITFAYRRTGELLACPQIAAPRLSKKELHGAEMRASLERALTDMREVAGQLAKMVSEPGAVSKTELRKMSELLSRRVEQAPGSVQFVHDQFAEATEKLVEQAKVEIEANVIGAAQRLGLAAMQLQAPALAAAQEGA